MDPPSDSEGVAGTSSYREILLSLRGEGVEGGASERARLYLVILGGIHIVGGGERERERERERDGRGFFNFYYVWFEEVR